MPPGGTVASRSGTEQHTRGRTGLHSLRTKFVLFSAALVVVPGAVFAILAFSNARRAIEEVVGEQLVEVARDAADGIISALETERGQVRTWARSELMRDLVVGDVDKRIARYLASLREGHPEYLAIVVVDSAGNAIAATDRIWLDRSYAAEDWWRTVQSGSEALVGPLRTRGTTTRVLEVAAPVVHPENPSRHLGALLLVYDWRRTETILEKIRGNLAAVGSRLDLLVVDGRGVVIGGSWSPALDGISERALHDLGWKSADAIVTAGGESILEETVISALIAREPLDTLSPGWRAVAVWPLQNALAPIRRMQRSWSIALALILVAGIGIAMVFANRMVGPLRALTDATRELALHGRTKTLVPVSTRDEIGDLGRAFNSMAAELDRARDDLVNAAKFTFAGQVAAGIAHEVRTPLGVLRTSAQMLGRSLGNESTGGRRELVDMIVAEVDRLEGVVAELLELSRPREPAIEEVPLDPVLRRAADFLAPTAREKGVRVELASAVARVAARGDSDQIYQVVLNLTVNAIQALGAGGTVRLRSLAEADGFVGFEVEDDGPGIRPEDRDHLFTPFFTKRPAGTGLGLAIVERIVQSHHGRIEVESAPGHGARFRIRLPAASAEAAA